MTLWTSCWLRQSTGDLCTAQTAREEKELSWQRCATSDGRHWGFNKNERLCNISELKRDELRKWALTALPFRSKVNWAPLNESQRLHRKRSLAFGTQQGVAFPIMPCSDLSKNRTNPSQHLSMFSGLRGATAAAPSSRWETDNDFKVAQWRRNHLISLQKDAEFKSPF